MHKLLTCIFLLVCMAQRCIGSLTSPYTDDRNSLYVYIYGFYLNFMDSGISPENLPLYKGKSAEGGKGSFCDWRFLSLALIANPSMSSSAPRFFSGGHSYA